MNKIRRKITVSRFFQVLAYFLSFPLLIFLTWNASRVLRDDPSASKLIAWLPVLIVLGIFVVVSIVQLIVRGTLRKNRLARAAIVGLIAAVLIVGSVVSLDTIGKSKYEKIREDIKAENGTEILSYERAATYYEDELKGYADKVDEWIKRYNLEGYEGARKGENTDGADVVEKDGASYKPNGMYADGYIFGVNDVRKILYDYYILGSKISKNEVEGLDNTAKKTADELLREEIEALETDVNSNWNKYKAGSSSISLEGFEYIVSNTEYEDAYGPDGTATKFYLTPQRLDALLGQLGNALSAENTPEFETLIGTVAGFLPSGGEGILGVIVGVLGELPAMMTADLNLQKFVDFVNDKNLWTNTIKPLFDDAGTTELFGVPIADTLTTDFVYKLLSNLSYYQSSTTYPIMYFIENQALKDYAYAKYYGQKHGAIIGSVLIPSPMSNAPGVALNVGKITLDSSGAPAPSASQIEEELKYFDNFDKYGHTYYPLLLTRAYVLKFGALAFFCLMLTYAFTQLIDNNYKKLKPVEA